MTSFVRARGVAAAIALAGVAVGVEKAESRAAQEVGAHEVQEQSGLAGARLADDVDMPAAVGLQERHALAGRERAEDVIVVGVHVRVHGLAVVPC